MFFLGPPCKEINIAGPSTRTVFSPPSSSSSWTSSAIWLDSEVTKASLEASIAAMLKTLLLSTRKFSNDLETDQNYPCWER